MQQKRFLHLLGFTIVEMLLVLVIVSAIIVAGMQYYQQRATQTSIDRTSIEMQQILSAGMLFYSAKSAWPPTIGCLMGDGSTFNSAAGIAITCDIQLLTQAPISPWFQPYQIASNNAAGSPDPKFYVFVELPLGANNDANALAIGGKLPLADVIAAGPVPPYAVTPPACTTASPQCTVVAKVMPPTQNVNNATSINFMGVYRPGGCIPAPSCPNDASGAAMVPSVVVVPVTAWGFTPNTLPGSSTTQYGLAPISGFSAYISSATAIAQPPSCTAGAPMPSGQCPPVQPGSPGYWRACITVVSAAGNTVSGRVNNVNIAGQSWAQQFTIAAFTRCQPRTQPSGGGLNIFQNY